jgi:hypothetical protein
MSVSGNPAERFEGAVLRGFVVAASLMRWVEKRDQSCHSGLGYRRVFSADTVECNIQLVVIPSTLERYKLHLRGKELDRFGARAGGRGEWACCRLKVPLSEIPCA